MVKFYGIIPARYASSRLPGKPLADIAGRPMFWHVWNQASQCAALSKVVVATDDTRIADAANALNVPCIMTKPDHVCGTDRVFEAATALKIDDDSVVVNIQGDEPLLDPTLISELTSPFFTDERIMVTTPVTVITKEQAMTPNRVKVVADLYDNALYFSRAPIPFPRDDTEKKNCEYLGHIGLYAFRMKALKRFVSLPQSNLESLEKLEQLRLLENGIPIRIVRTTRHTVGVDTPEDLERVRAIFQTR